MATLVGKAPLSLVRTVGGSMEYVYAGRPVPAGADPADVRRLLGEGFLVEVDSVESAAEVQVETPDDPGLVNAQSVTEPVSGERPPRAAPKEAWVDYAVAQGADRDAAEAKTKQELVDAYTA